MRKLFRLVLAIALAIVAFAGNVTPAFAAHGGRGGGGAQAPVTTFKVSAEAICDGSSSIAWSADVAGQPLEYVWVKDVASGVGSMVATTVTSTYRGVLAGDTSVDHLLLFRRLVNGDTEESVFVTVAACVEAVPSAGFVRAVPMVAGMGGCVTDGIVFSAGVFGSAAHCNIAGGNIQSVRTWVSCNNAGILWGPFVSTAGVKSYRFCPAGKTVTTYGYQIVVD